ncbi:MAG TPA: HD domain-containing protein [Solirubrobacteraceae bacterium]|nr:HD domain-containing protein [Solirubrobacteraceae bacterium]
MTAVLPSTRTALAGAEAWLVGGAVRDRLLGRATDDVDLVVRGDVEAAARSVARALGAAAFELSGAHRAWRVVARRGGAQIDLTALAGDSLEGDLAQRDFTVNAIAEPLAGGELIDPHGGAEDLASRRLRLVGPDSLRRDPLRVLRLARLACELELAPDPSALACARRWAPALQEVAAERVFSELKRIVACPRARAGFELMEQTGAAEVVLPELVALRGMAQNRYHHLDVHDHTLAVLDAVMALERDPGAMVGPEHAEAIRSLLAEPLADGLTRGQALRLGALLHDAAKPLTRAVAAEGRVVFPGHDARGAELSVAVLTRLRASERLRTHVADLARHHLRLGFLVHRRPLSRREIYRYLHTCQPVEVDVTLLSVADRLATRGDNAPAAIAAHLELARELLGECLRWRAGGRPVPVIRGDELADALSLAPGPQLGRLLAELAEAQFAGELADRGAAIELARRMASSGGGDEH